MPSSVTTATTRRRSLGEVGDAIEPRLDPARRLADHVDTPELWLTYAGM